MAKKIKISKSSIEFFKLTFNHLGSGWKWRTMAAYSHWLLNAKKFKNTTYSRGHLSGHLVSTLSVSLVKLRRPPLDKTAPKPRIL